MTVTVPAGMSAYLEITTAQGNSAADGIQCDAYDPANNIGSPEFVGASVALNHTQIIGAMPNGVGEQGTVRTPVLSPGTYTVGIVAWCQPPDAVNDPQATYFLSAASLQVTRVAVNIG
jgi:hypothetical protein